MTRSEEQTDRACAAIDYQQGRFTQVPIGRLISVSKRVSRKIGYNNVVVAYERHPVSVWGKLPFAKK